MNEQLGCKPTFRVTGAGHNFFAEGRLMHYGQKVELLNRGCIYQCLECGDYHLEQGHNWTEVTEVIDRA